MATPAAMPLEGTPPPVIGKAGSYTVFITPPAAPKPPSGAPRPQAAVALPPPVQVPPQQFGKPSCRSSNSVFGFFWGAVAKVQDAHSSLDEYLADWFGLNQSKYQWALDDYYQKKGMDKGAGQTKDPVRKRSNCVIY